MKEITVMSSLLIAAIIIIRKIFRKSTDRRVQYAMWLIVALHLLIFPFVTVESPISVANLWAQKTGALPSETIGTENLPNGAQTADKNLPNGAQTAQNGQTGALPSETIGTGSLPNGAQTADKNLPNGAQAADKNLPSGTKAADILKTVYFAGVCVFLVYFAVRNAVVSISFMRRRIRYAGCECKRRIYLIDGLESPCALWGSIYMPPECTGNEERMKHIITHEMMHFRHFDTLWAAVRCVCLILYWYNPFVWAAAYLSARDAESACDESVIKFIGDGERDGYGRTLIQIMHMGCKRNGIFDMAESIGGGKSAMTERIKDVAGGRKSRKSAAVFSILAALCAAAVTFTTACAGDSADTGDGANTADSTDTADNANAADSDEKALALRNEQDYYNGFTAKVLFGNDGLVSYVFDNACGVKVTLACEKGEKDDTLTVEAGGSSLIVKDSFSDGIAGDDFMLWLSDADGNGRKELFVSRNNKAVFNKAQDKCYIIDLEGMTYSTFVSHDRTQIIYGRDEDVTYAYFEEYKTKSPIEYADGGWYAANDAQKQEILDKKREELKRSEYPGFTADAYYGENGVIVCSFTENEHGVKLTYEVEENRVGKLLASCNGRETELEAIPLGRWNTDVGVFDIGNDGAWELIVIEYDTGTNVFGGRWWIVNLDTMEVCRIAAESAVAESVAAESADWYAGSFLEAEGIDLSRISLGGYRLDISGKAPRMLIRYGVDEEITPYPQAAQTGVIAVNVVFEGGEYRTGEVLGVAKWDADSGMYVFR